MPNPHSFLRRALLVLFCLFPVFCLSAEPGTDLLRQAPYTGGITVAPDTAGLVRVPLSEDWLRRAGPDQQALRLLDDAGTVVPFVIARQSGQAAEPRSIALEIVDYARDRDGERLILRRDDRQTPGPALTGLRLETRSRTFHREVVIEKSTDGETWETLAQGSLFDLTPRFDFRRTRLAFPETDAPWIRLRMLPPLRAVEAGDFVEVRVGDVAIAARDLPAGPTFRVDRIVGEAEADPGIPAIWDRLSIEEPPTSRSSSRETAFDLGCPNVPLERVEIVTPQVLLARNVRLDTRESAEVNFRLAWRTRLSRGPDNPTAPLRLEGASRHLTCGRLVIEDGDNPPLRVSAIHLEWHRRELVFLAENDRTYTLLAGSPEWTRPRFELAGLISTQPADLPAYPLASAAPPAANPLWKDPESPLRRWWERTVPTLLGVFLILMTILLGYWIWRILSWQS